MEQLPSTCPHLVGRFKDLRATHPDLKEKKGEEILAAARKHCMQIRVLPQGSTTALQSGHLLAYIRFLEDSSLAG